MNNIAITELATKAQNGDRKAKEELAMVMYEKANNLAKSYAGKIVGGESYIDDYKHEAMIGMLESLESYDSAKGSFSSYADYAMRQKIRDYLNFKQRIITQPKNITEKISKFRKIASQWSGDIKDKDIQRETGYSLKIIDNIKKAIERDYIYSLDLPIDGENGISLMNTIEDKFNLEDMVITKIEYDKTMKKIESLKESDKLILFSSFGSWGYRKRSNRELAALLGVSSTSINNYKKQIVERLRGEVS